ncbi:MAG: glycosyltransferase family 39 protein [Candidatus Sungbacteria bacterium]|uniref:Glycosyltransferase family 39 protein n=1 Tax=Candidatus Sungiibacteriota bacterium TaxID=2750080 RepID=A0A931YD06_9BACT|nr:glycosyltransferase family 39 protein [Candidatus Sungbacteria bacterium]MBI2465626.1 glycosyltransferase family 39 protein [Candidatus Sungbacteria bacterium]
MSKHNKILILILLAAAFLRLWGLGSGELVFDEALYAFRSIGWLDYLESAVQTTPIQWLADQPLPWWQKLSFHDHPPFFFLTQKISFSIFGDSLFASRLPSALAGIVFVYLIYLIGQKLFQSEPAGLAAALIAAVSFAQISVSRLAMMESVLFFFVAANIYCFLRMLDNYKHWPAFGITLGLAFLTKYIAIFLIPTYFLYLIINKRSLLKDKQLYAGLILAALVFSPVIIYNIYSYQTFGHFDLQFSYLLNQKTPWPVENFGGKTQDPFSRIGENLTSVFSWPFLISSLTGLILILRKKESARRLALVLIPFVFITLLLTQTGSAIRFVSLYVIPFVFLASVVFIFLWQKNPRVALAVLAIFTAHELFFTSERVFINPPDYGVAKLDKYFDSVFNGGRSQAMPSHPNPHLNKVIQKYALSTPVKLFRPAGIIYDDNIATGPMLWLFSRRQYYQAIPIMKASQFQETVEGIKGFDLYFIKAEAASPVNPIRATDYAERVENMLQNNNQKPAVVVYGNNNQPAFKVYKFSVQ